jgi:uncharacterized repeat protein (TIGR03943 family)
MSRATQGLALAFLGAVVLRVSLTDEHLRYVKDWMQIPLILSGILLMIMAVGPLLGPRDDEDAAHDGEAGSDGHAGLGEHGEHGALDVGETLDSRDSGHDDGRGHGHGVPAVTWLLLLPGLITFVIAPPALGAYLAERRTSEVPEVAPAVVAELPGDGEVSLQLNDFLWRAKAVPESITGRPVTMTGFVSYDEAGEWYLTRLSLRCCAADAAAYRVKVEAADTPPRDTWLEVTGTWVEDTGPDSGTPVTVEAISVQEIEPPTDTYQ